MENKPNAPSQWLQDYLLMSEQDIRKLPEGTAEILAVQGMAMLESDGKLLLDYAAEPFVEAMASCCDALVGKPMPDTLDKQLKHIAQARKKLLAISGLYTLPAHGQKAFDALKMSCFRKTGSTFDAFEILMGAEMAKEKRPKGLKDYEKYYFEFLAANSYSAEYVFRSYARLFDFKEIHSPHFYYRHLNGMSLERLEALYSYGRFKASADCPGLLAGILTAISVHDSYSALGHAKELLSHNHFEALQALSRFNSSGFEELQNIYQMVNGVTINDESAAHAFAMIMAKTIMHPEATPSLQKSALKVIAGLLSHTNHKIADSALWVVSHEITGFEKERYSMLHIYIGNTKNIKPLKYAFHTFSSPDYVFDLMIRMYEATRMRMRVEPFGQALSHFWDNDSDATEQQLLRLFEYAPAYAVLGVMVMLNSHSRPYRADLLKLGGNGQINAIVAICNYPHSIEELLMPLLALRKSQFNEVVTTLQEGLSMLIKEAYHETLYERAAAIIDKDGGDDGFLAPLKQALDEYLEIRNKKEACKEFDPVLNERKHFELYYGLEHEANAKAMKDFDKGDNSWLSAMKNTVIVRGKAWKTDGDDRIMPLAHIQTSMLIDARAYKNPPAYERMLDNLEWK